MRKSHGALATAIGALLAGTSPAQHLELEEIIVTASPLRASAIDLAQSAIVLAGDDLRRGIASSIGESLASLPGVSASYFGPRASRPIIRGLSGERVLMLQDGVSALDVSNLSPDHSVAIEDVLAEQVEILKGPTTLLYGSGAVGGVVNVVDGRIPDANDEGLSGAGELRTDTATGELSAIGKLDARVGAFGVRAALYDRSTDDIEVPGYAWSKAARDEAIADGEEPDLTRGKVRNSDSDTNGGTLGASWIGDHSVIGFAWSRHETDYGLPGPGEHHEEEGEEEEEEEAEVVRIEQEQDRYDFKAEWRELDGWLDNVLLRAAYNDYEHVELEGSEVGTRFEQTGLDARLHLGHRTLAGWDGTLGFQYTDLDLEAVGAEAYVPPSQTEAMSAFVIEQQTFGDLTLDFGARLERQDIETRADARDYSETAFTLAGGLLWRFDEALGAAVHLTRSERHPQAPELYANGPHLAVGRFEIGDDRLDSEVATTIDVGLRAEGELHWHVSVFYSDFADYIYADSTGEEEDGLPVFQYTQGDAEFYGLEAELEFPLYESAGRELHGRVGGDYVRGKLDGGENLPQIPPLRLMAGLEFDSGPLHAALEAHWYDDQDDTARNELPTDGGVALSAEFSYRWEAWNPGILLFVRGTNLLDEELRRHASPLKEYVPLPGRSLMVGLRAEF
jgi:iron complex outermembrane receptor protein